MDVGYKSAQQYYATLKLHFMQNIQMQEQQQITEEMDKLITRWKTNTRSDSYGAVQKGIEKVNKQVTNKMKKAINKYVNQDQSIQKLVTSLKQDQNKSDKEQYQENLKQLQELILQYIDTQKEIFNLGTVERRIEQYIKQQTKADISVLKNNYMTYYKKLLMTSIDVLQHIYTVNRPSLAGYYQEFIETKVLNEFFSQCTTNLQAYQYGQEGKDVSKYADIIIGTKSNKTNAVKNITKNTEKMLEVFKKAEFTSNVTIETFWDQAFDRIKAKAVGEQSKLYTLNLEQQKQNKWGTGYKIGERLDLLNQFNNIRGQFADIAWSSQSVAFFNNSHTAIIEALGPMNLFFKDGVQRYFLDELIQNVYKSKQRFMFLMKENQYTSSVIIDFVKKQKS